MSNHVRSCLAIAVLAACSDPIGPRLELHTGEVALGDIKCASSSTGRVTLENTGDAPLELALTSTLAEVAVSPSTAVLAPGQRITPEVTATVPAAAIPGAASSGDLVIATNEAGEARTHALPVSFRSTGVAVATDRAVDFGQLLPGDRNERTFAVTATGRGTVLVELGLPSPFGLSGGSSIRLSPGSDDPAAPLGAAEHRFQMYASGTAVGAIAADMPLTVTGDVCGAPPPPVQLTAAITNDAVTFDRNVVDFGTVTCATGFDLLELAVTNRGEQPTDFEAILTHDPDRFVLGVAPRFGAVGVGETKKIQVANQALDFEDIPAGPVLASFDVKLNGGAITRPVPIRAFVSRVLLGVSPADIQLGDVRRGTTVTRTFTIANTGNLTSSVSLSSLDGVAISPSSFQLVPMGSRTITISVTPQQPIGTMFQLYVGASGSSTCGPQRGVYVRGRVIAP